jgi:hypothetical protein
MIRKLVMTRRGVPITLILVLAVGLAACGDDDDAELSIDPQQLEQAIQETANIPGSEPEDLDVECELRDGDGIEDPWDCVVEANPPLTRAEQDRFRVAGPEGRGYRVEMIAWITPFNDPDVAAGSFAAVQVGGDGVFEGGGATGAVGCCIEGEAFD